MVIPCSLNDMTSFLSSEEGTVAANCVTIIYCSPCISNIGFSLAAGLGAVSTGSRGTTNHVLRSLSRSAWQSSKYPFPSRKRYTPNLAIRTGGNLRRAGRYVRHSHWTTPALPRFPPATVRRGPLQFARQGLAHRRVIG